MLNTSQLTAIMQRRTAMPLVFQCRNNIQKTKEQHIILNQMSCGFRKRSFSFNPHYFALFILLSCEFNLLWLNVNAPSNIEDVL